MIQTAIDYASELHKTGMSHEELSTIKDIFDVVPQVKEELSDPTVSLEKKHLVIQKVFSKNVRNFLQLLCDNDDINLFDLNNQVSSNAQEQNSDDVMLPGFEDETPEPKFEQPVENKPVDFFKRDFNNDLFENNEMPQLPGMESFNNNEIVEPQEENKPEEKNEYEENGGYLGGDLQQNNTQNLTNSEMNNYSNSFEYFNKNNQIQGSNSINTVANSIQNENTVTSNLVTSDCKIVSFVGTSKNGTSFLVNNLAVLLSNKGIKTAILDLTKNKNAYYIYTLNEDALREKSFRCIDGLRSGVADGIQVSKNLTVYTTLPGENPSIDDYENILCLMHYLT